MKGVERKDLDCIIDFLYYGETNVLPEFLERFLQSAKELQINGIEGVITNFPIPIDIKKEIAASQFNIPETSAVFDKSQPDSAHKQVKINSYDETLDDLKERTTEYENMLTIGVDNIYEKLTVQSEGEFRKKVELLIGRKGSNFYCKVCTRVTAKKNNMKRHVEIHIEGFGQRSLDDSVSYQYDHQTKDKRYRCDHCGVNHISLNKFYAHKQNCEGWKNKRVELFSAAKKVQPERKIRSPERNYVQTTTCFGFKKGDRVYVKSDHARVEYLVSGFSISKQDSWVTLVKAGQREKGEKIQQFVLKSSEIIKVD